MPGPSEQTLRQENEMLQAQVFTNGRQVGCSGKMTKLPREGIAADGDTERSPTLREAKGQSRGIYLERQSCGATSIGSEAE